MDDSVGNLGQVVRHTARARYELYAAHDRVPRRLPACLRGTVYVGRRHRPEPAAAEHLFVALPFEDNEEEAGAVKVIPQLRVLPVLADQLHELEGVQRQRLLVAGPVWLEPYGSEGDARLLELGGAVVAGAEQAVGDLRPLSLVTGVGDAQQIAELAGGLAAMAVDHVADHVLEIRGAVRDARSLRLAHEVVVQHVVHVLALEAEGAPLGGLVRRVVLRHPARRGGGALGAGAQVAGHRLGQLVRSAGAHKLRDFTVVLPDDRQVLLGRGEELREADDLVVVVNRSVTPVIDEHNVLGLAPEVRAVVCNGDCLVIGDHGENEPLACGEVAVLLHVVAGCLELHSRLSEVGVRVAVCPVAVEALLDKVADTALVALAGVVLGLLLLGGVGRINAKVEHVTERHPDELFATAFDCYWVGIVNPYDIPPGHTAAPEGMRGNSHGV